MNRDLAILMAAMECGYPGNNYRAQQLRREAVEPPKPRELARISLQPTWIHKLLPLKTFAAIVSFFRLS